MPKFSILTPVHLWSPKRVEDFQRCIESVKNINYSDFEWIVVDDGSVTEFNWDSLGGKATVIHQPHLERVCAYNKAFKVAIGEWIIILDSDDEVDPNILNECNRLIKLYPTYSIFNFGCKYIHEDGKETFREPFEPKKLKVGHEIFGGGNIVNGTFIFKKAIWKELGGFPDDEIKDIDCSEINYGKVRNLFMGSPYDFSAYAQLEFPELRKMFMVNHEAEPSKILKELGNPWGQDFYMFYKLTRKYHSKPIKGKYLYWVHPR